MLFRTRRALAMVAIQTDRPRALERASLRQRNATRTLTSDAVRDVGSFSRRCADDRAPCSPRVVYGTSERLRHSWRRSTYTHHRSSEVWRPRTHPPTSPSPSARAHALLRLALRAPTLLCMGCYGFARETFVAPKWAWTFVQRAVSREQVVGERSVDAELTSGAARGVGRARR